MLSIDFVSQHHVLFYNPMSPLSVTSMCKSSGPPTGAWVASHSWRKLITLAPKASQLGVGFCQPSVHLYWDIGRPQLAQVFKIITAHNSWVLQSCYVQQRLSVQLSINSGSYNPFTTYSMLIPELWKEKFDVDVPFRYEHTKVSMLFSWLCVHCHLL